MVSMCTTRCDIELYSVPLTVSVFMSVAVQTQTSIVPLNMTDWSL